MKHWIFTTLIGVLSFQFSTAQIRTPEASPLQKTEQIVGVTKMTIEYSRPSIKNRVVFGDLVPYGQIWRTGANWNTKISFDEPILVDGNRLEPGTYALYTIPNSHVWEFIFYENSDNWGLPEIWDEDRVVAKIMGEVMTLPINYETFTISIDNITHESANLGVVWEKTYVSIPIKFITDEIVQASISETIANHPEAEDYYAAAVYYLEADKDMNQALEWINQAIKQMGDNAEYFVYRQQALIYAKLGNRKEALKAAEKSLKLAEQAGNEDYVTLNKKSIEAWSS